MGERHKYPPSLALVEATRTPEKPEWTHDLYTISEDGHFIGQDGFVVPRSFEEFFERHPRYVRGRVRLCWPNGTDSEREDHESELLIFLMSLPDKSKFRALGYNGFPDGCKDRIQTFDPDLASLLQLHQNNPDEPPYLAVAEGRVHELR
jgi:hypothetical protein